MIKVVEFIFRSDMSIQRKNEKNKRRRKSVKRGYRKLRAGKIWNKMDGKRSKR